jgi:hypothetical protein
MRPITYRPRPSQAVYRRRRLVVLLAFVSVVALGWLGLHQLTGASGGGPLTAAGRPVSVNAQLATNTRVIVQPGDTLWSLARRAQPTGDVRPLVAALDAARHGRMLEVGESIDLPPGK